MVKPPLPLGRRTHPLQYVHQMVTHGDKECNRNEEHIARHNTTRSHEMALVGRCHQHAGRISTCYGLMREGSAQMRRACPMENSPRGIEHHSTQARATVQPSSLSLTRELVAVESKFFQVAEISQLLGDGPCLQAFTQLMITIAIVETCHLH